MRIITTIIKKVGTQFRVLLTRAMFLFFFLFIFFIVGGGLSQNEKWRINQIEVVGEQAVSKDDIVATVQDTLQGNDYFVYARNNSYLFSKRDVEHALLSKFPRLAGVEITRTSAHALYVKVWERKPFVLWCGMIFEKSSISSCWYVDDMGFIFDEAPIFSKGTYVQMYGFLTSPEALSPLGKNIPRDEFKNIRILLENLMSAGMSLSYLVLKENGEINFVIYTSRTYPFLSGVTVHFRKDQNTMVLTKNLVAALPVQFPQQVSGAKKLEYIDLRFGNKVFFGFEN